MTLIELKALLDKKSQIAENQTALANLHQTRLEADRKRLKIKRKELGVSDTDKVLIQQYLDAYKAENDPLEAAYDAVKRQIDDGVKTVEWVPEASESLIHTVWVSEYHNQGFSAPKYARGHAEMVALRLRKAGFTVRVVKSVILPDPEQKRSQPIDTIEIWANALPWIERVLDDLPYPSEIELWELSASNSQINLKALLGPWHRDWWDCPEGQKWYDAWFKNRGAHGDSGFGSDTSR